MFIDHKFIYIISKKHAFKVRSTAFVLLQLKKHGYLNKVHILTCSALCLLSSKKKQYNKNISKVENVYVIALNKFQLIKLNKHEALQKLGTFSV